MDSPFEAYLGRILDFNLNLNLNLGQPLGVARVVRAASFRLGRVAVVRIDLIELGADNLVEMKVEVKMKLKLRVKVKV